MKRFVALLTVGSLMIAVVFGFTVKAYDSTQQDCDVECMRPFYILDPECRERND